MDNDALKLGKENRMREVRVEKVTVNCCVGEGGAKLEKASKILESICGQKPQLRRAKKTVRGFGIRKGEPIALRVTLRKAKAVSFLLRALKAVNNKLNGSSFDEEGNVSFGIHEHLDLPDITYDPELGIIGMDVSANLSRRGLRVKLRRRANSSIGRSHRVSKEEAIRYMEEAFGVRVEP